MFEPVDADRLPDGRTLVVESDRVREFERDGRAIAEFLVEGAAEANKY